MEAFQRSAVVRGRELLEELIIRTPAAQTIDLAAAYLELADWNQWNDRRAEALQAYEQVIRLLREAGREDLLQQWLGQSLELPANGAFWQVQQQADGVPGAVLHARYDVSERGRARNIVTSAEGEENDRRAGKLRRGLAQTRFRPRFEDGRPVADTGLARDYELLN
jgi:hypothetical protein